MKQHEKLGKRNEIGALGEQIAVNYLKKRGYWIVERNYLKKWGEIDIVAHETLGNAQITHFVEVKAVSYETKQALEEAVTRRTWRPEENVHREKLTRLKRAIETWLIENKTGNEWQIDVIAVRLVPREKFATVKHLSNVILD
jgi:putative endonuclease